MTTITTLHRSRSCPASKTARVRGAMTFAPAALAAWEPSQRYPDPAVQSFDPS
jgi:hypothetical protein